MPRFTAEQIYALARQAGFSPDQSATMTAIALAESGGDSRSHATVGEDSRGLWQINAASHPDLAGRFDLYDPAQNAQAAYLASHNGTDVSPWTTTHGGLGARYVRFKDDAQAAAAAYGDGPNRGVWTGTIGYGHPLSPGDPSGGRPPANPTDAHTDGSAAVVVGTPTVHDAPTGPGFGLALDDHAGATFGLPLDGDPTTTADPTTADPGAVAPPTTVAGGNEHLRVFLDAAVAQKGDRYIFGVMDNLNDPNPSAFDCSMLVQWSAHQAGTDLERNAWHQYRQLHGQGMTQISVQDAIHTPGALLFHFSSDPMSGGQPVHEHVAISLGNGKTIEALGAQYGVNEFDATTKRFNYAAVIPGISDHVGPVGALPDPTVVVPPPDVVPAATTTAAPTADLHPQVDTPDAFLTRLSFDPDTLDTGQPGSAATAPVVTAPPPDVHPADPAPPHFVDATVDADADGLDDSLQLANETWTVPHPPETYHDDGWDHGGHH